jgi:hypothetical protein
MRTSHGDSERKCDGGGGHGGGCHTLVVMHVQGYNIYVLEN